MVAHYLSGFQIHISHMLGTHPTRQYKVRFNVHPIVKWLARWLPINPWIEAEYPDEADPILMGRIMFCPPRAYEKLMAEFKKEN